MKRILVRDDEVEMFLREFVARSGYHDHPVIGVQILVRQPFGADMTAHNEIPAFSILLGEPR